MTLQKPGLKSRFELFSLVMINCNLAGFFLEVEE